MQTTTIVPAAGCGARAALKGNKILAPLLSRPLLSWTLEALLSARPSELIVACRADERAAIRRALEQVNAPAAPIVLVEGGATRQDSVLNAVRVASGDWVLVHDAARPCVLPALIEATLRAARESGAAIAALRVFDTVKRAAPDGSIAATLDRNEIWLAQTPQVFERAPFLSALEAAQKDSWQGTDCASIMERAGQAVALVPGEADNLKVTYAADLERAAAILRRANSLEKL